MLIGERREPRGAWQFPQGGIEEGEHPEVAVAREMGEELGVQAVEILARVIDPVRYHFPVEMRSEVARRFRGQDQIWFKLALAAGIIPDLAQATDQEFIQLAWVTPAEALRRVVAFKREAYVTGLEALGLIPITEGS